MTYNFDERIDRTGRGQAKWEPAGLKEMFGDENMLSYWVADMDFRVAQPIRDALIEAAEHGCIGYTGLDLHSTTPTSIGRSAATAGSPTSPGSATPPALCPQSICCCWP